MKREYIPAFHFIIKLLKMAKDLKPHIGIFGRRNNGKSSIINKLTGQDIAIVSDFAGTTTDPVKKSMEIFGIGPAVIIDTAGIDDYGELGTKRVEKTYQTIKNIDCAILVITNNEFDTPEIELINRFTENDIPFLVIHNKSDIIPIDTSLKSRIEHDYNTKVLDFNTINGDTSTLTELLKKTIPETSYHKPSLLGDIIKPKDVVVLVTPIDAEAPDGRMILPQVMAIRDVLDNDCICVVVKETNLQDYFEKITCKPALVVTDSQVFAMVNKIVPPEIPLTSFSIVLARLRGDFDNYAKGTSFLSQLKDDDKILMLESCTHQVNCEDIGRYKIPNLIRKFTKKNISFDYVSGLAPIENIEQYAMVIQCGGCMVTRKQLINRTNMAVNKNIPISNYGMTLAYLNGIFDRAMEPFRK